MNGHLVYDCISEPIQHNIYQPNQIRLYHKKCRQWLCHWHTNHAAHSAEHPRKSLPSCWHSAYFLATRPWDVGRTSCGRTFAAWVWIHARDWWTKSINGCLKSAALDCACSLSCSCCNWFYHTGLGMDLNLSCH